MHECEYNYCDGIEHIEFDGLTYCEYEQKRQEAYNSYEPFNDTFFYSRSLPERLKDTYRAESEFYKFIIQRLKEGKLTQKKRFNLWGWIKSLLVR